LRWAKLRHQRPWPSDMTFAAKAALLPVLLMSARLSALADDAPGVVWPDTSGRATISAPFLDSPITIGISRRTAGAIDSLTWRQHQFVNANDHGREFQSASSFGGKGECFNPTEAGSAADATGGRSTSKLLSLSIGDRQLTTRSLMAYWIGPRDRPGNCHGTTSTVASPLSDDVLTKRIAIGSYGLPNVIRYDVTFSIPERRRQAGFEVVTGYMPPDFKRFWAFNPTDGSVSLQAKNTGGQELPLVVSTVSEEFALGLVSSQHKAADGSRAEHAYGRWDFTQPSMASPTTKWNSYFKIVVAEAGNYGFTTFIVVGSLDNVRSGMRTLCGRLPDLGCSR
jgi:hypothetical protein